MNTMRKFLWLAASVLAVLAMTGVSPLLAQGPAANMSFFITSENPGNGANFGGLAGADAHCQALAAAAGAGNKTWHAYLSTTDGVNARDRIGTGPWFNYAGVQVAASVADLHSGNNNLNKETGLSEKGEVLNGVGDTPNRHDILTGSNADGTASANTCNNWTGGEAAMATLGHFDRQGGGAAATSWNSSHDSRAGCGQMENLRASGGEGYLYCFAIN
jgi:hypothetical protein